jgi:hypothetical protein
MKSTKRYNAQLNTLFQQVDGLRSNACTTGQIVDQRRELQDIKATVNYLLAEVAIAEANILLKAIKQIG